MSGMAQKDVDKLKELRLKLSPDTGHQYFRRPGQKRGDFSDTFTEEVRKGTRLWRETWILPVLDELIEKYDRPPEKEQ